MNAPFLNVQPESHNPVEMSFRPNRVSARELTRELFAGALRELFPHIDECVIERESVASALGVNERTIRNWLDPERTEVPGIDILIILAAMVGPLRLMSVLYKEHGQRFLSDKIRRGR